MTVLWLFLAAAFGGAIGFFACALLGSGAKADLELELVRANCAVALAHQIGDLMCAELAEELRRKDIKVKTRHRIGDLLYRWGALRPTTTTSAVTDHVTLTNEQVAVTAGTQTQWAPNL
jgi:hypothetical protein